MSQVRDSGLRNNEPSMIKNEVGMMVNMKSTLRVMFQIIGKSLTIQTSGGTASHNNKNDRLTQPRDLTLKYNYVTVSHTRWLDAIPMEF